MLTSVFCPTATTAACVTVTRPVGPGSGCSRCMTINLTAAVHARRQQLGKVVALALVFCVAIVLSNVSLRIIPVSFNQVIVAPGPRIPRDCRAAGASLPDALTASPVLPHQSTTAA